MPRSPGPMSPWEREQRKKRYARQKADAMGTAGGHGSGPFRLSGIFPPHPKVRPQGPVPKQRAVYRLIFDGRCQGGGIVWQGGKGCMKTLCGSGASVAVALKFPGVRTAICRETYASLLTSTYDEWEQMVGRLPPEMRPKIVKPSQTSMGRAMWPNGSLTLFLSLRDSQTWESSNLGFVWVDEAHLQREAMVEKLATRLRQPDAPRTMLLTTNPAGKGWIYRWAHPKSARRLPRWGWFESNMFENPTLPADYIERMEAKYPPGTPAHDRWVLGKSTALEGSVFADLFKSDPESMFHVVPDHKIPDGWRRGRGLDWGVDNPCVVVWGALDPQGRWWIYRTHTQDQRSAAWHADTINELEGEESMLWTPADPEIFRKVHPVESNVRIHRSTAQTFRDHNCRVTPANNNRAYGLQVLMDLMTPDKEAVHPCHLTTPAPSLFILDNPSNEALIDGLERVEWRPEARSGDSDGPDDVKKKDDHHYDALRYLVATVKKDTKQRDPKTVDYSSERTVRGSRSYVGYH